MRKATEQRKDCWHSINPHVITLMQLAECPLNSHILPLGTVSCTIQTISPAPNHVLLRTKGHKFNWRFRLSAGRLEQSEPVVGFSLNALMLKGKRVIRRLTVKHAPKFTYSMTHMQQIVEFYSTYVPRLRVLNTAGGAF